MRVVWKEVENSRRKVKWLDLTSFLAVTYAPVDYPEASALEGYTAKSAMRAELWRFNGANMCYKPSRSAEFLPSLSHDQIHQPLEILGGIERDSERALFVAGQINLHIRLQVLTQFVFDLFGRRVRLSRGRR